MGSKITVRILYAKGKITISTVKGKRYGKLRLTGRSSRKKNYNCQACCYWQYCKW